MIAYPPTPRGDVVDVLHRADKPTSKIIETAADRSRTRDTTQGETL
jgi:hypothetical protein